MGRHEAILGPLRAILAVLEACWAILAAWLALMGRFGAVVEPQGGPMAAQGPPKVWPIQARRRDERGGPLRKLQKPCQTVLGILHASTYQGARWRMWCEPCRVSYVVKKKVGVGAHGVIHVM